MMNPFHEHQLAMTRRHFFANAGVNLGAAALASMSVNRSADAASKLLDVPHFAPRAKRAIYLFMAGAPCQMDMFDHKPGMNDWYDQDLPDSIRQGQRLTTMTSGQNRFPIAPTKYKFAQYGQSGAWVSELMPYTSRMVDQISFVRSIHTEAINHDPAITYICTGHQLPGRASLGAWLSYGLGAITSDLPAFVVMTPRWSAKRDAQALYNRLWGAGFLAGRHQGVSLRSSGDPVLFLSNPPGIDRDTRRRMLDRVARFNQRTFQSYADPETQTRVEQGEMAFRMQASVPEMTNISDEPQHILDMYGPDVQQPGTFASSALLARRMAERGVRFVQIFHRGWDQHSRIARDLPLQCRDVDQPCWALIQDLKMRGMLDDTLVVWGGEFGRTIYCQGKLSHEDYGRDHHPKCFTIWMTGGGVKPGLVHGKTDDFCYNVVEDPVHIHELNATILKCLGIDHKRLTYKFQGLDMRLTGVEDHGPVDALLS